MHRGVKPNVGPSFFWCDLLLLLLFGVFSERFPFLTNVFARKTNMLRKKQNQMFAFLSRCEAGSMSLLHKITICERGAGIAEVFP